MSGLRSFFFCLFPALLAYLALLIGGEKVVGFAIILIIAGAGISGSCVALHIHRGMEPKGEANAGKVFLGILAFLGIVAGYLAIGLAGCCGIAAATM